MDHRGDLPEEKDPVDAACFLADGLLAEEKYDEAIRFLRDEMNKNQVSMIRDEFVKAPFTCRTRSSTRS